MVRVCKCEPFIYVRFTTKILKKKPKVHLLARNLRSMPVAHKMTFTFIQSLGFAPKNPNTLSNTLFSDALVMGSEVVFEYRPNFAH